MTSTVPVVIVSAGPTGVTAATLLAQYGIECLVLDRWENVYPQPPLDELTTSLEDRPCSFRLTGRLFRRRRQESRVLTDPRLAWPSPGVR